MYGITVAAHIDNKCVIQTALTGHYPVECFLLYLKAAPAVDFDSDSDFAAAYRRDPIFALTVADELIDTLSVTNPAIYRSVIRNLHN